MPDLYSDEAQEAEGPPDLIYLQWHDVDDYTGDGAITWCADQINADDVCYIRVDWLLRVIKAALGGKGE